MRLLRRGKKRTNKGFLKDPEKERKKMTKEFPLINDFTKMDPPSEKRISPFTKKCHPVPFEKRNDPN